MRQRAWDSEWDVEQVKRIKLQGFVEQHFKVVQEQQIAFGVLVCQFPQNADCL